MPAAPQHQEWQHSAPMEREKKSVSLVLKRSDPSPSGQHGSQEQELGLLTPCHPSAEVARPRKDAREARQSWVEEGVWVDEALAASAFRTCLWGSLQEPEMSPGAWPRSRAWGIV